MLDDTSSSATDHVPLASDRPTATTPAAVKITPSGMPPPPQAKPVDQTAKDAADERGFSDDGEKNSHAAGEEQRGHGIPRVTLPHLRAILEHGGGMSTADISEVCGSVWKAEESRRQQRRNRRDRRQLEPVHQSGSDEPEGATTERALAGGDVDKDAIRHGDPRSSSEGAGENASEEESQVGGGEVGVVGRPSAAAAPSPPPGGLEISTEGEAVAGGVPQGGHQEGVRRLEARSDAGAGGHGRAAARGNHLHEEKPLTVSFVDVCDCSAVRTWVRRGAFTLPSFEVTSGRGLVCTSGDS